jgi:predicted nucleic acid-binding protein
VLVHLDTDFLVYALSVRGPERKKLDELARSEAEIEISAVAWYEFSRGPRTAEQLAVARSLFGNEGIRSLGSPRRRAADIAIGVTAAAAGAALLTRNARDFARIPDLRLETAG